MLTIVIEEEVATTEQMQDLLQYVAGKVSEGYTGGAYPHWRLEGEESEEDE